MMTALLEIIVLLDNLSCKYLYACLIDSCLMKQEYYERENKNCIRKQYLMIYDYHVDKLIEAKSKYTRESEQPIATFTYI